MFLGEVPVLLDQGVDTVNHLLDKFHLRVAEPVLVRDVVGEAGLTTGLSPGAARLEMKFLGI